MLAQEARPGPQPAEGRHAAEVPQPLPRHRLPGLLRPEVLRARFLPLCYDNSRMRETLGLRQAKSFEALMHEAQG